MTVVIVLLLLSAVNLATGQYDFDQPQVLPIGAPPAYEPPLESTTIHSLSKSHHVPGLPKPAAPTPTEESLEGPAYGSSANDLNDVMSTLDSLAHESGIACPVDVLFIVDSTSSVKAIFEQHLEYIMKVLEGLTISERGDRVGVILYSSRSMHKEKIKLGSINDPAQLMKAIKRLPFLSGVTATGAALTFAEKSLEARRSSVKTNIVIITDGFSFDIVEGAAKHIQSLPNVRIFSVTIGDVFVQKELELIAGSRDRVLHGPSSYAKLVKLIKQCEGEPKHTSETETATVHFVKTATDSKGRHLIPNPHFTSYGDQHLNDNRKSSAEESGDGSGNGETTYDESKIGVESGRKANRAPTVSGSNDVQDLKRNIESQLPSSTCLFDLALIFDASGSVTTRFAKQLQTANRIIENINLGQENTQVAAIKYAGKGKSRVLFDFTEFTNKIELKKAITAISFMSGTTYTNEALMKAVDVFQGPGARPKRAKQIAIVFTDGFSGENPEFGAEALRKMGVLVFAVAIDENNQAINRDELDRIAGDRSRVYTLSDFGKFEVELSRISKNCLRLH